MRSIRLESRKRTIVLGCLLSLLVAFCLWSPASTATSNPTVIGTELIRTEEAAQGDSCWSSRICVEECLRFSDGTVLPMGKFCCVEPHQLGTSAMCSMASRVNGPV